MRAKRRAVGSIEIWTAGSILVNLAPCVRGWKWGVWDDELLVDGGLAKSRWSAAHMALAATAGLGVDKAFDQLQALREDA